MVIIGAGYAGTGIAAKLEKLAKKKEIELVVVERKQFMLHKISGIRGAVLGGTWVDTCCIPLDKLIPSGRVIFGNVSKVDSQLRRVYYTEALEPEDAVARSFVEWERAGRGKHNGQGLFETSENRGSFVLPEKLRYPGSFVELLRDKYEKQQEEQEMIAGGVRVEKVGMDAVVRRQRLENLEEASLIGAGVGFAGSSAVEIQALLPRLKSLDLAFNLLTSWSEVETILMGLTPRLTHLSLSDNRLGASLPERVNPLCFRALQELVCNQLQDAGPVVPLHVLADWNCFSSLLRLYLSGYAPLSLASRRISPESFPNLRVLDLSANGIDSWALVDTALGELPRLERLYLQENPIPEVSGAPGRFPALQALSLRRTLLDSYKSINELHLHFPNLRELSLANVPLSQDQTTISFRHNIISRLGSLRQFNGSEITKLERADAERLYLKRLGPSPPLAELHPRYAELVELHGPQHASSGDKPGGVGTALSANTMKLSIRSIDPETCESVSKALPLSMTVLQLRTLCSRQFKIPPGEVRLQYASTHLLGGEVLEGGRLELHQFDIQEGGEILVSRWGGEQNNSNN